MDSASLLEFDTEAGSYQEQPSKKTNGKSHGCCYIAIVLIIIAGLLTCIFLLFLHDSPPSPTVNTLDLAIDVVNQLNGSSMFSDIFKVPEVEDQLNDVVISTLTNHSSDFKSIDVFVRYSNTFFDRNLSLFTITLTLHDQTSTTELIVYFDYDDATTVTFALDYLYNEFFNDEITIIVPSDTIENREQAISEFCLVGLNEFPSIISNNIHTEYGGWVYYTVYLTSGSTTNHVKYLLHHHVIDQKATEELLDGYMEKILHHLKSEFKSKCLDGRDVYESSEHRKVALYKMFRNFADDDVQLNSIKKEYLLEDVSFRDEFLSDTSEKHSRVELGLGSAAILHKQHLYLFHSSDFQSADFKNNLYHKLVTDVALGDQHFIVLTDESEVYCYGLNNYGQLGVEDRNARYSKLNFSLSGAKYRPVEVYAGGDKSGAVTFNDQHPGQYSEFWLWGSNFNRELSNQNDVIDTPQKCVINPDPYSNVRSIAFGTDHTVVLAGLVYTRGSNKYGQLGNGKINTTEIGWNIVIELGVTGAIRGISRIVAGDQVSFASCESKNRLFVWGRGRNGLLMTGNEVNHPYALEIKYDSKDRFLIAMSRSVSIAGLFDRSNEQYLGAGNNTYNELLTGNVSETYVEPIDVISGMTSITSGGNNIGGFYYNPVSKQTFAIGWGSMLGGERNSCWL
ncbi:hypothetical protein GEMRC1_011831 [Eukaryota sp. GEM-RC1]